MKILVADDSALYRSLLKSELEGWGYEVVLAADGYEAQQFLESDDAPQMAILDCLMPGLGGLELCELIRARKQGYIYAILLSADNQDSDVERGFEFGADDYLCKPFNKFELRTRLRVGELIIRSYEEVADAHDALRFEASHDYLLRVWNRRAILEVLGKEISRAKRAQAPISVLLADLDLFRKVNEGRGYLIGDEVLRSAAERVVSTVRNEDHVGRYEGEEFLVVLPNCTAESAREVSERIRHSIAGAPLPDDTEITVSIGVSQWRPGMEIHNLLHRAEVALYRAKQNGRNRVEVEDVTDVDRV